MAKAWIVLGLFLFFYFVAPSLFRAMARHDYGNLQRGLSTAHDRYYNNDDGKEFHYE